MMSLNLQDCEFITSAVRSDQYPKHRFPEVALVGRSNVGKSSLINALVNRKRLAQVSGQPGRTQTLNFYRVDRLVLVDLPGYGYAKVSQSVKARWQGMIEDYLVKRKNLAGLLMVVDIRHQPTADDILMADWIVNMNFPAWVVATKSDKISRTRQKSQLDAIMGMLNLPGFVFSAATKIGRDNLIAVLNQLVGNK